MTSSNFYKEISKYYDSIFPVENQQVLFLTEILNNPPGEVLDVACGTGGYALEVAKKGYSVTASDLDAEMIKKLAEKSDSNGVPVDFITSNMLELEKKLNKKFDLVFCIGNSLVHLDNLIQIKEFLNSAKNLIDKSGSLVIQIINFDRIILKDIKTLPTLENEEFGLCFERNYNFDRQKNIMYFSTRLSANGKVFENEVPLYPLLCEELKQVADEVGFNNIKLFGDFCGNEFNKYESFMLVMWARSV